MKNFNNIKDDIVVSEEGLRDLAEKLMYILVVILIGGGFIYDQVSSWLENKKDKKDNKTIVNKLQKYRQQIDTVRKQYIDLHTKIYKTVYQQIKPEFKKYIINKNKSTEIGENFDKEIKRALYKIFADKNEDGIKHTESKDKRQNNYISKNNKLLINLSISFNIATISL